MKYIIHNETEDECLSKISFVIYHEVDILSDEWNGELEWIDHAECWSYQNCYTFDCLQNAKKIRDSLTEMYPKNTYTIYEVKNPTTFTWFTSDKQY